MLWEYVFRFIMVKRMCKIILAFCFSILCGFFIILSNFYLKDGKFDRATTSLGLAIIFLLAGTITTCLISEE